VRRVLSFDNWLWVIERIGRNYNKKVRGGSLVFVACGLECWMIVYYLSRFNAGQYIHANFHAVLTSPQCKCNIISSH
jgi:hypothetical protein